MKEHIVCLKDEARQRLQELVRSGTRSVRVVRRASILLKSDEGFTDEEIAGAEGILKKHPDLPAMVSTHMYLTVRPRNENPYSSGAKPPFNSPATIRKKFIQKQPQIFFVVSGHLNAPVPSYRMDKNEAGGDLIAMVADFQLLPEGGQGWLVLLTFDPAKDEIRVQTYSPTRKEYMKDPGSQYALPYSVVRQRLGKKRK